MSMNAKNSRVLATEGAVVFGMLGHLHLLDDLTESRTIASPVLTADTYLLCVLSLEENNFNSNIKQKELYEARIDPAA